MAARGASGAIGRDHWSAPSRSKTPLTPVCRSEQIHGVQPRIYKCGEQQYCDMAEAEMTSVAETVMKQVAGIDVGKQHLEMTRVTNH